METATPAPHKVDQLNDEVLSDGHFPLHRLTLRTQTYAGDMSRPLIREVLRSGRSVAILLYDPAANAFILTEQFRLGAWLNHLPAPWLTECVAGMVDPGETPEAAAAREVEEETGCHPGPLELIGHYLTSPGITDELISVFIAHADSRTAGGIHGKDSEAEDIRTLVLPVDQALAAADRGEITNVVAQLALLWFARHGAALRQRWLTPAPPR